jgi:acetylornithine/N-succinyldiaminopimelate aminotransferase
VRKVSELCAEKDVLLIVDEVQTGIGRTGTFFCFQCYGIKPDIVTAAKGIAGGLPMGAVLAGEKTENVLGAGTHASTFGGNPICAAAANAVLDILEGGVLAEVTEKGEYIREKISEMKLPQVLGLRGLGLMIGVAVAENSHKSIVSKLVESGLLCISAGKDAVRFLPPLTITCEEIDAGLEIFRGVLSEI